jgi:general secretion pathway protein A
MPEGYEQHFGFVESPFTLTSNPRFLFESAAHLAALREIAYALPRREPIIVVTGAIGTGKTTLCRIIAERRGPRTFVATINTAPASADDLLRLILDGFNILADDTSRIVQATHYGLLRTLQQFLGSLVPLNAQAIILFDEAQHLSPEMLEQIRLLSNIDVDSRKLLQIILVGQPELDEVLAREDLRQLRQRISRRHHLGPLQPEEVTAYIDRRISVAREGSTTGMAPEFTPAAMRAITTISNGVPRIINTVCDRALEDAWSRRTWTIDAATVIHAATSLEIHVPRSLRFRSSPRQMQAAAAVAALAGLGGLWWAGAALLGDRPQPAASAAALDAAGRGAPNAPATVAPSVVGAAAPSPTQANPPAPAAATPAALSGAVPAAASATARAGAAAPVAPSAAAPAAPSTPAPVVPSAAAPPAPAAIPPASVTTEPVRGGSTAPPAAAPRTSTAAPAAPPPAAAPAVPESTVSAPPAPRPTAAPTESSPAAPAPRAVQAPATPAPAASGSLPAWATRRPPPARGDASPPLADDAPIADVLERASALASQPNVRALQQIRNQVAKRHAAATGDDAEALRVALEQVDKHLDTARRRQLEDDARRLSGDPGR